MVFYFSKAVELNPTPLGIHIIYYLVSTIDLDLKSLKQSSYKIARCAVALSIGS